MTAITVTDAEEIDLNNIVMISMDDPDHQMVIEIKALETSILKMPPMVEITIGVQCGIPQLSLTLPPLNQSEMNNLINTLDRARNQARVNAVTRGWVPKDGWVKPGS